MTKWVRLWEDMPTDPKWRVIARRAGRPISEVLSVFVFMMTNAAAGEADGELSGWDDEDVAAALDIEAHAVESIRQAMQGKTLEGDRLSGWEKRQPKREDNSVERTRAWRERKKDVTQRDAHVTQCDAPDKNRIELSTNVDNKPREPTAREILLECLSEKTVTDLIAHRQAKRAKMTPRAARELVKAFTAYGDAEAAAAEMILRGWTGFKPDWMVQATSPPGSNVTALGAGKPRERDLRNVPDALLSADDYWKKRRQQREWA